MWLKATNVLKYNDKIKSNSNLQETLLLEQIIDLLVLSGNTCPLSGI